MEMQVDSKLIRSEREKRAWSQEHLARLTDLGLRTIQRIERTGAASYESVSAIASVLSIPVAELRIATAANPTPAPARWWKRAAVGGLAGTACVLSVLIVRTALAEPIMLDVGVSLDSEETRLSRLLVDTGRDAEIRIDGVVRIVIVPTIRDDGSILLTTSIFEYADGGQRLLSEPRVATADGMEAEIRLGSDAGHFYRFLITPHLQ